MIKSNESNQFKKNAQKTFKILFKLNFSNSTIGNIFFKERMSLFSRVKGGLLFNWKFLIKNFTLSILSSDLSVKKLYFDTHKYQRNEYLSVYMVYSIISVGKSKKFLVGD